MSSVDTTLQSQNSHDNNNSVHVNTINSTTTERRQRLQHYLSLQYVDFDQAMTTDRLKSLYSDFSKLKLLNPYGYVANINYWKAVMLDCNLHGFLSTTENSCFIDSNELAELFYRPKMGKPLSMDNVVEEISKEEGPLLLQNDYEKRYPIKITITNRNEGWFQWLYHWMIPKETPKHLYIVLPTVHEFSRKIIERHYQTPLCSSLDHTLTFLEFKEKYGTMTSPEEGTIQLSDLDLILILRYLHAHHGVDVEETQTTTLSRTIIIKFPTHREAVKESAKIVENDKAIVKVKSMCALLSRQVNELQVKSEELLNLSREQLRNKHKSQAVYFLRKKQKVERLLEKNLKVLETMETVLLRIETAQNDLQIVHAFNLGADTLRTLLHQKDFNVDTVQETMDHLQDTLDEHKEVEDTLSLGNQAIHNEQIGGKEGQKELEDELNNLMMEDKAAQQKLKNQQQEHSSHPSHHFNSQPIETESELLRLQTVLTSLNNTLTQPSVSALEKRPSSMKNSNKKQEALLSS
ncbi:hypothetical protein BDF20DRAFT_878067 [Mycotypha africana]|uniref:uncharacterized protein n=1 Tax=Mycotypha africana TaxID=64632 RepID=UPI0022FFDA11|nr:uncharacterized protein BDF20DRAFT_878067 [Mycotypha africana]KAI8975343.1 hypothetical protein BDF20DRAFT_878067 [Mycotypha africana]